MAEKDDPSFESAGYKEQIADWTIVDDCFRGNRAIVDKGREYLPQHEKESEEAYAVRLARSTFWNAYKRTVQGLVGMVFRKNPQLADDVPATIAGDKSKKNAGGHAEDIDLQGNHLDVFSREVFRWALNDGHACILVDMPKAITSENPEATLADERAAGVRPYWVLYRKDQIKNWRTTRVNGVVVLVQVSLYEKVCEPSGEFGEEEIEQYRVLSPGSWRIYRRASEEGAWIIFDEGTTSLDVIPLVEIATNPDEKLVSKPPLLDLAHENLRHYRLRSDLDHILHYATVPILVEDLGEASGSLESLSPDAEKGDKTISPNSIYRVGKGGSLSYVEPNCSGVERAQAEIEGSRENMSSLGLALLESKVQKTATESTLDYEAESSELGSMARSLEDGLEQALKLHANYLGEKSGGSVKINRDFSRVALDPSMISQLSSMVAADELPIEELWKLMQQAEILSPDFDAAKALAQLKASIADRAAYPTPPTDKNPNPPPTEDGLIQ